MVRTLSSFSFANGVVLMTDIADPECSQFYISTIQVLFESSTAAGQNLFEGAAFFFIQNCACLATY